MKHTIALCLALMPLTTACAAMFRGTSDQVMVSAQPDGGFLVLDDVKHPLPFVADLPRKTKQIVLWHPHFGERSVPLDRKFSFGYLLMDVLFTPGYGVVGIAVDGVTHAWYDLPTMATCNFSPSEAPPEGEVAQASAPLQP